MNLFEKEIAAARKESKIEIAEENRYAAEKKKNEIKLNITQAVGETKQSDVI